jgi:hypothetical protein
MTGLEELGAFLISLLIGAYTEKHTQITNYIYQDANKTIECIKQNNDIIK